MSSEDPHADPQGNVVVHAKTMEFLSRRALEGVLHVPEEEPEPESPAPQGPPPSFGERLRAFYRERISYADTHAELEDRFQKQCAEVTARTGLFLCLITGFGTLVLWPTDPWVMPDEAHIRAYAMARGGALALLSSTALALWRFEAAQRNSVVVVSLAAWLALTWVAYSIAPTAGLDGPWFAAIFVLLPMTIFILVGFWKRLIYNLLVAGSWVAVSIGPHPAYLEWDYTGAAALFLCCVIVFSVGGGHVMYHLQRRAFFQNLKLGEQRRVIAREQRLGERLLLNVLPRSVADRLKGGEQPIADGFDGVTVLFADIADFTPLSAKLSPAHLVELLNDVFSEFDTLADRYGLEKIKTIGDAYMLAGGLPEPRPDHAHAVADMALDMVRAVDELTRHTGYALQMRIGLHSGPVVAGVIGTRKFIYDLWGDTVNVASRMESHGVAGGIQVTAATRELLGDDYRFESRGTIEVKGKGPMEAWLLVGRS